MADFHEAIKEPQPPKRDIWHLPRILDVEAVLRRYRKPRVTYERLERIEHNQAVELLVKTSEAFPVRALAPVLYVGDERVPDWEAAGENIYRFFAFDPERLREGAPLALGWPDDRQPRRTAEATYRLKKSESGERRSKPRRR